VENVTDEAGVPSRIVFGEVEELLRRQFQERFQTLLEEELTEFLGRDRYERIAQEQHMRGHRNGHGKPRKITMSCGTITVRRPRVRGLDEKFEGRLLPLFVKRTETVSDLLPRLYLHGLAEGDMDKALRGLLGDDAPISAGTVARLKSKWHGEFEAWSKRDLSELEVVYLWVDGVYVKAGMEKDKAAVLVAVAGLSDGSKTIVAMDAGYRESSDSWSALLRSMKKRGMSAPRLVVGDGHLGIWHALSEVFPGVDEQRCWVHKMRNVIDKLPKRSQKEGAELLKRIQHAGSTDEALALRDEFQAWCRTHGFTRAAETIEQDWDRMITFMRYPRQHWQHLRTTNPVESPFNAVRIRTDAARRYKRVENATAVIWKTLQVAEKSFRRLSAPHLMKSVFKGAVCEDGVEKQSGEKVVAA